MASPFADEFRTAPQRRRRVRVVGKVSSFLEMEGSGVSVSSSGTTDECWISVIKSEESSSCSAEVTFKDQQPNVPTTSRKDSYRLDWCYEKDEDVSKIFLKEVEPLVQGIFQGQDASVVAFGARGSGKTLLIEGSKGKPGLAPLAMSRVLDLRDKTTSSIKMSCYGIQQERVIDLLEDGRKEVHVLEDANGIIQLKGLSQVSLKSMMDFDKLYFKRRKQHDLTKKENFDTTSMTRGTIIYAYPPSQNEIGVNATVGRIHFVDLAEYVDTKAKSEFMSNISEVAAARRNKSLYVLQKVISSFNANEIRVPYRESKVTHLLKDFMSKEKSQTLIITCLVPTHCQGTIQALKMASRSISITKRPQNYLSKNIKNSDMPSSMYSASSRKQQMLSSSVKKYETSQHCSSKKINDTFSTSTARKLFTVKSPLKSSRVRPMPCVSKDGEQPPENMQVQPVPFVSKDVEQSLENMQVQLVPFVSKDLEQPQENTQVQPMPCVSTDVEQPLENKEKSLEFNSSEADTTNTAPAGVNLSEEDVALMTKAPEDGRIENLETTTTHIWKSSPPLSVQLREITNSLKIMSTQQIRTTQPFAIASGTDQTSFNLPEPKTPGLSFQLNVHDDWDTEVSGTTPHDILKSRSVGVKKTLIDGLLTFLNTASKEELKELKGIGEKRATYMIELRKRTPQPFTNVNDLREMGLSSKQVKEMVKNIMGDFYT